MVIITMRVVSFFFVIVAGCDETLKEELIFTASMVLCLD